MAKLVSKVYSDALFEVAREKDLMDTLFEEAKGLYEVFDSNGELLELLNHPKLVREEKLEMLQSVFSGRISDEWMGFLTAIVEKGRQKDLLNIISTFIGDVKEYKHIGVASVERAVELRDEQKARLEKRLLETTSYVEFEMKYSVKPELIGGLVIRIGDRVVDSSIRTQLYEMKRELMELQLA